MLDMPDRSTTGGPLGVATTAECGDTMSSAGRSASGGSRSRSYRAA
ncbi:hypothetical protein ACQEVB_08045 [Pseudonocardia sp. CA-107938]